MAVVNHTLNLISIVVDTIVVLTIYEECSMHASSFDLIQNIAL
jgi:hypothetical protein